MHARDYPHETVTIACSWCDRLGLYRRDRFAELVGSATLLPDALTVISADCPRRKRNILYDQCGAFYVELREGAEGWGPGAKSDGIE